MTILLKDMTVGQVESALSNHKDPNYDREWSWYDWEEAMTKFNQETKEYDVLVHEVRPLGWVQVLENFGGEGQGDSMYIVFKVWDQTGTVRHFKMNGWYQSHCGGEFDGPFEEVKPVTREVTFYE